MADKNDSFDSGANARSQIAGGFVGGVKGAIGWGLAAAVIVTAVIGLGTGFIVANGAEWIGSSWAGQAIAKVGSYLGFTSTATAAGSLSGTAIFLGAVSGLAAAAVSFTSGLSFAVGQAFGFIGGGIGVLDGAAKGNAEHGRSTVINAQQQAYDMEMARLMQTRGAEMQVRMTEAQAMQQQIAFAREAMMAEQAARLQEQKPKALAGARTSAAVDSADGAWAQKVSADKGQEQRSFGEGLETRTEAAPTLAAGSAKYDGKAPIELTAAQAAAVATAQPNQARV